jgi:hypothetical protein
MGVGKAVRLHLRYAALPARCASDVPIMAIGEVPAGVTAGVTLMVMVICMSIPCDTMMRSC